MTQPSEQLQIELLLKVQRVVAEGEGTQKSASYKFVLLLALANLAIERGADTDAPLKISVDAIAEQFIRLYWRQVVPYVEKNLFEETAGGAILIRDKPADFGKRQVLLQNAGSGQAKIVTEVRKSYESHGGSLANLQRDDKAWRRLLSSVGATLHENPFWRLQAIGGLDDPFLYDYRRGKRVASIELKSGVAFTLRRFHGLIQELVRGAWARFVGGLNPALLGNREDLQAFLFGSERASLEPYRPILREIQEGTCFYCEAALVRESHVDHFIPWSRYPVDLGHNFVLAHKGCNEDKSNLLAAVDHLEHWCERNLEHGKTLDDAFNEQKLLADLDASRAVTRWAYELAERSGSRLWLEKDTPAVDLDPRWATLPGL